MKPNCTLVLENSWIFDMPISIKPSFVNMDLIDESLHLNDFIHNDRWSLSHIHQFLSPHINFESLNLGSIDDNNHNIWSWSSKSQGHGIISEVYKTLNASQAHMDSWKGWKNIWRINSPPKTKFFIWLLLLGIIKTLAFLHNLNLVSNSCCGICGAHKKTSNIFSILAPKSI